jgi:hypothetical protein
MALWEMPTSCHSWEFRAVGYKGRESPMFLAVLIEWSFHIAELEKGKEGKNFNLINTDSYSSYQNLVDFLHCVLWCLFIEPFPETLNV